MLARVDSGYYVTEVEEMARIYISYSRKDIAFVRRLAGDLEKVGYDVWWDLTDLRGGDDWVRVIPGAIEASEYILVVLSPSSVDSDWVRREYAQALSLRKKIIPIMLEPSSVPFALNTINYLDFAGDDYTANLNRLLEVLGYTGELPAIVKVAPVRFRKYVVPLILGFAILLALLSTLLLTPLTPPIATPSDTPSKTPTASPATPGMVVTPSDTSTATVSPTVTRTPSPGTPSLVVTPSDTPSATVSPTFSATVSPTVTSTPAETRTATPSPTSTVSPTPTRHWIIEIYEENRNNSIFWIFTTSLGIISTYIIGVGALLVSAWRVGSTVFSRSWLTKLASRSLLAVPGLGRWALFIGYGNRLSKQQDVHRAASGYFGLPAVDPTGAGIFDSSGNALHEEIAKSLDDQKPVLVLAKGGGGKTTLLARWSFLALQNGLPAGLQDFKPIFVTPAYYNGSLIDAIASVLRERDRVAVDQNVTQAQLESGKFLVLVDGVSEIESDQNKGLQEILRTAQKADYRNCRFLITTRPGLNIPPEISVFQLQPLSSEVVLGLLHLYQLDTEQEFLIRGQLKLFGAKPIEPLLFSMILDQGKSAQVSRTRSLLYEKYFRRLLRVNNDTLWEGWNVILGEFANWFTIETGHRGLGMMHEGLIDKIAGRSGNAMADNLLQRTKGYYGLDLENELDLLETLRASGIMLRTRRWRFAHDTFEEYFAACYIISYITRYEKLPDLSKWTNSDAQIQSFMAIIEFIKEMADEEILKILLDSGLPALWLEVLSSAETREDN